ncbi:hypothetical protein [Nostoc sp.]|uniref:hypothetical protein n=1 Tax=Nostoc sp. TaxID=1180 RepID=UPI002FF907D2
MRRKVKPKLDAIDRLSSSSILPPCPLRLCGSMRKAATRLRHSSQTHQPQILH